MVIFPGRRLLWQRKKIKLYGFNNLTKTLSFNIYDMLRPYRSGKNEYVEYIDEQYNAERLTKILCDVTEMIGAHVLNISKQDYDPQGPVLPYSFLRKPFLWRLWILLVMVWIS